MGRDKALDAGCRGGHTTKHVLNEFFYEIDMFDSNPYAVKKS